MPFLVAVVAVLLAAGCVYGWYNSYAENHGWLIVGGIGLAAAAIFLIADYTQTEEHTILVTDKDRGGDSGSYRVYTENDTLGVKDIWLSWSNRRFNSADLFGSLKVCHRYEIRTRGWEFGPLDMMPNIDQVVEDLGLDADCEPPR